MSPSVNHSYVQARLTTLLGNYKQYSIFTELSIEIEGKEYVPDICIYSKRKFDPFNDQIRTKEIPLLVIEVLSPTQVMQELADKIKMYINAGVQSCWLVVPLTCTITVYHDLEKMNSYGKDNVIDDKLNISLPLSEIFLF
jgi:Uma2 family endonuclease